MTNCEFSIIKYAPNMARFEPVNIGIALMDKDKKQVHNKFISDFNRLFLRLGVDKIHGLERSFEKYASIIPVESDDYLWKIRESFHASVFYSEPIKITSENIPHTLEQIFTKMISIKDKEPMVEDALITKLKKRIRDYFLPLKLGENYCEQYAITGSKNMPQIPQFAFLKNKKLAHTIDTFNFSDRQTYSTLRLFMYDINTIIESKIHPDNKPHIFSVDDPRSENISDRIRESIKLLNKKEINIIPPEAQRKKLEEIKASMV